MKKTHKESSTSNLSAYDKIIMKKVDAAIQYEDDVCIAFNEPVPQAPVHVVILPKIEPKIVSFNDFSEKNMDLLAKLCLTSITLGKNKSPRGYRLVINVGEQGGQTIPNFAIHVLGGRKLKWPPG